MLRIKIFLKIVLALLITIKKNFELKEDLRDF